MRRVLIDHARGRKRQKRGGDSGRDFRDLRDVADALHYANECDVLALDDAITHLESENSRVGEVVRLRFFAGLSAGEVANVLDVSRRTVMSDWAYAKASLYAALHDAHE